MTADAVDSRIEQVSGTGIPLVLDDIDTDRIIPARFLRCVTFDGLGEHAFEDDRQQDPAHPFNDARYDGAAVLLSGRNFGCGSSREHAPQALMRHGIRAVVAESFAEIFFGNCTSLGIVAVCAPRAEIERLAQLIAADPSLNITVDLTTCRLQASGFECECTIPESARQALTTGQYDFLGSLLAGKTEIGQTAGSLPYLNEFQESAG